MGQTDLIAMLHSIIVSAALKTAVEVFEPPALVPGVPLNPALHSRRNGDHDVQHVVGVMSKLVSHRSRPVRDHLPLTLPKLVTELQVAVCRTYS